CFAGTLAAATAPQDGKAALEWERPDINEINREPIRATSFPFESVELARANRMADSRYFQTLNGDWRFAFSPSVDRRPADFYRDDFDVSAWKTIP
ncbi:hypothetical protein AB4084_37100, partial [Lysobacter sp. 2RAB21]